MKENKDIEKILLNEFQIENNPGTLVRNKSFSLKRHKLEPSITELPQIKPK